MRHLRSLRIRARPEPLSLAQVSPDAVGTGAYGPRLFTSLPFNKIVSMNVSNAGAAPSIWGRVGAIWGVVGVVCLLSMAIGRLGAIALDALQMELSAVHWLVLVANAVFMAHAEGYKGFQRGFSPRVIARARYVMQNPSALTVVLAPLFCMSFFGATRARLLTTYLLTTAIVSMVALFQYIPQPWRGILDFGVVVGLVWGVLSLLTFAVRAIAGRAPDVSPELPHPAT